MVMIILGNYKNNYDIATKTAQWALTPKQLNLVLNKKGNTYMYTNKQTHRNLHVGPTLTLLVLNKKVMVTRKISYLHLPKIPENEPSSTSPYC